MEKKWKTFKKLHRWPGLIVAFFLFYYGITGIFMNHRELFAGWEISRKCLPSAYSYKNWNNAALKGNVILNPDSILVYGNIGVWLTDSTFRTYTDFNSGIPKGADNRKVTRVYATGNQLYLTTLFGIYAYNSGEKKWQKLTVNVHQEKFNGISCVNDTLYVSGRSYLFKGASRGIETRLVAYQLPAPDGYVNKVTLFHTIWQIHSGEIFGLPGKLFIDLLGLLTVFLSVTGMLYFFFPDWIKRRVKKDKSREKLVNTTRWTLKWHNKLGAWTYILLAVLFFTGIFLRPPFLLLVANAQTSPIKFSHLDQPNPWYDKLRDILYVQERDAFLLSTSEGMYYMNRENLVPVRFEIQPPVSVMGINTLERYGNNHYLIGSFSGLFLWAPQNPQIINFITGTPYQEGEFTIPVGDIKVTGVINGLHNSKYVVDYDRGVVAGQFQPAFPEMPENVIAASKISVWNACLEIHTGRVFQGLLGMFYILIVPLSGLAAVIVVISGYFLWKRNYKVQKK